MQEIMLSFGHTANRAIHHEVLVSAACNLGIGIGKPTMLTLSVESLSHSS
jgi:hypothetical protein